MSPLRILVLCAMVAVASAQWNQLTTDFVLMQPNAQLGGEILINSETVIDWDTMQLQENFTMVFPAGNTMNISVWITGGNAYTIIAGSNTCQKTALPAGAFPPNHLPIGGMWSSITVAGHPGKQYTYTDSENTISVIVDRGSQLPISYNAFALTGAPPSNATSSITFYNPSFTANPSTLMLPSMCGMAVEGMHPVVEQHLATLMRIHMRA